MRDTIPSTASRIMLPTLPRLGGLFVHYVERLLKIDNHKTLRNVISKNIVFAIFSIELGLSF